MASNSTIAALQPVVERYITASDGTQIFATAVGQSHLPSLVFVHGYAFSTLIWESIIANSDLLKQFYLVAYDLRGHGRSGNQKPLLGICRISLLKTLQMSFENLAWTRLSTLAGAMEIQEPFQASSTPPQCPGQMPSNRLRTLISVHFKRAREVPTERMWSWIGSASLVGPLSTQLLLAREQDPEPLLKAGAAGFPTLLITGGKDIFVQSDVLKAFLERNFTNMATYNFPEAGHAMFYDFKEEYAKEVARFAASVFGNKTWLRNSFNNSSAVNTSYINIYARP
ncbi:Alpha/Beta hydrolase protein [Coprinopsis sp. MPI-PUGE-AT-0042]|nr:Alpha/Beta hydrolase protein [Coprinopsis sp. MPI-PUGE-AT-0042]